MNEWWNPKKLEKAGNAFDNAMRDIIREVQQKVNKHNVEQVKEKIAASAIRYLNDVEQARILEEGKQRGPALDSNTFKQLSQLESKSSELVSALRNFNDQVNTIYNKVVEEANKKEGKGKSKPTLEFAEDRYRLLKYCVGIITAIASVFSIHRKDLINFVEAGKNWEGAKVAMLAATTIIGSYATSHLTHKLFVGDNKEVKAAIKGINDQCQNMKEAFQALAKEAAQVRER